VSQTTRTSPATNGSTDSQTACSTGPTRYDLSLATIPLLLGVACFVALLSGVSLPTSLAVAASVSLALIVDVTSRNPPCRPGGRQSPIHCGPPTADAAVSYINTVPPCDGTAALGGGLGAPRRGGPGRPARDGRRQPVPSVSRTPTLIRSLVQGVGVNGLGPESTPEEVRELSGEELEATVRDLTAELRAVVDAAGDAVFRLDPEGRIETVGPGVEEVLGYTPDALAGRPLEALLREPPGDRTGGTAERDGVAERLFGEGAVSEVEATLEGADGERAVSEVEATLEGADGEAVPARLSTSVTRRTDDGEPAGYVCVARDVSERRAKERELETLTRRYEYVLEQTDTGVWDLDEETGELFRDAGAERLFGYEPGEFPAPYEAFAERVHDEDLPKIRRRNERAIREGSAETEFRVELPDGSTRWLLSRVIARTEDGEATRLVGVQTDITERKERERDLRRKNELLDEFAGVVSHDIATPLGIIQNKARLAEVTGDVSHLEEVYETTEKVRRLIDRLRDLAREGDYVGGTAPVPLEAAATAAWESIEAGSATLTVDAPGEVEADRDRLRQLFENLLRNAVEHGGHGVSVEVGTLADGFYVADDGPGIPPDERDRAFERGYTSRDDSVGLGLAIVRRIADGHGWDVDVTESEAGGARFEIRTE